MALLKKFNVRQVILCEVAVWKVMEAENIDDALVKLSVRSCTTGDSDVDYEIISDIRVLETKVREREL